MYVDAVRLVEPVVASCTGPAPSSPADHWLVDCVHTPETGFWRKLSGASGRVGGAAASEPPARRYMRDGARLGSGQSVCVS